jgi:hypothetical protein
MSRDFMQASALRGLSERTVRLLDRQSWYEGTNYDHLKPWEPFYGVIVDENGTECVSYLPKRIRRPGVQLGIVREKVDRLRQELVGRDKWATVTLEGSTEDLTEGLEGFKLRHAVTLPIQDVMLKGSGALGFILTDSGVESRYLEPEWCTPIFVSQVKSAKAAAVIAEYDEFGIDLGGDGQLPAPEGAEGLDLAYLRYQWRVDEEILDGHVEKTVITWFRRDYHPNMTVEFEPIEVKSATQKVLDWKPVRGDEPHNFGVVPFVWMRPEGTVPGDTEGPGLVTPQLLTMAEASDYSESFRQGAYEYNAFPRVNLHDSKLLDEHNASADGRTNRNFPMGDPGAFLRTKTSSASGASTGTVSLMETTGEAISKGIDHSGKLREHVDRHTGIREFDRTFSVAVLSGTALERLLQPKIAVITNYRSVIEENTNLLWQKINIAQGGGGDPGKLVFTWPRIIEISSDDAQKWVTTMAQAVNEGLTTREAAIKKTNALLGIEGVEAIQAALANFDSEREAKALALATAAPPVPDGEGGGGGNEGDDE